MWVTSSRTSRTYGAPSRHAFLEDGQRHFHARQRRTKLMRHIPEKTPLPGDESLQPRGHPVDGQPEPPQFIRPLFRGFDIEAPLRDRLRRSRHLRNRPRQVSGQGHPEKGGKNHHAHGEVNPRIRIEQQRIALNRRRFPHQHQRHHVGDLQPVQRQMHQQPEHARVVRPFHALGKFGQQGSRLSRPLRRGTRLEIRRVRWRRRREHPSSRRWKTTPGLTGSRQAVRHHHNRMHRGGQLKNRPRHPLALAVEKRKIHVVGRAEMGEDFIPLLPRRLGQVVDEDNRHGLGLRVRIVGQKSAKLRPELDAQREKQRQQQNDQVDRTPDQEPGEKREGSLHADSG
jgi:hypothetical protein